MGDFLEFELELDRLWSFDPATFKGPTIFGELQRGIAAAKAFGGWLQWAWVALGFDIPPHLKMPSIPQIDALYTDGLAASKWCMFTEKVMVSRRSRFLILCGKRWGGGGGRFVLTQFLHFVPFCSPSTPNYLVVDVITCIF